MLPANIRKANSIFVRRGPGRDASRGFLTIGGKTFDCLLGKNGISVNKREGDMATPAGSFRILFGYYRKDRIRLPPSGLSLKAIRKNLAWCDDPVHPNYNRPVDLPFSASHENMQRQDTLYDIVIVMDHNFKNRKRGMGSAVFFHLTAGKPYTAGCIAISGDTMLKILPGLSDKTVIHVLS